MRSSTAARSVAALAAAVLLTAGLAGAADAAKGGGGGNKGGKSPKGGTTTTSLSGTSAIAAAQADVCPKVVEYTSCSSLTVDIADFGNTGWAGYSHPASESVDYNSYYNASQAAWSNVVAHEVGGHIDTWNQLVHDVGATQAWTDYYDIDYFAVPWATAGYKAATGGTRTFSTGDAKEAYLDCAGPVAHGYQGNYLYIWGMTSSSQQSTFCRGYGTVYTEAITQARP